MDSKILKIIDTLTIIVVCIILVGCIGFWFGSKKEKDFINLNKVMTAEDISQFEKTYGWTPPYGYTKKQLLDFMKVNPNIPTDMLEQRACEAYEKELEKTEDKELLEYENIIKGTIVEQVQNIAIPSYLLYGETFAQLRSGEITVNAPKSDDFPEGVLLWFASLEKNTHSFIIGDFNKDGLDDVAHIIGYSGGGSGYFYHLMIFVNDNGKLKYLTDEYFGDRIIINSLQYESGMFVIDMITQGKGENFMGYSCPNTPATIRFKLENNKLVQL